MRYLVQDAKQGRTSKKMLLFDQGEFLYFALIFTVRRLILLCHDVVCVCTFKLFFLKICLLLCACIISTAKWILFLNHRNRKVVGGKYNVLVHWRNVGVPNQSGFVLCNPLFISGWKSVCLCACVHQQQNKLYSSTTGTEMLWEAHIMF